MPTETTVKWDETQQRTPRETLLWMMNLILWMENQPT